MEKDTVLAKIDLVLLKRGSEERVKEVLVVVKHYVESQTGFNYDLTMQFIQTLFSSKLGGAAIYINKALSFLKEELKAEKKKEKEVNKLNKI